MTSAKKTFISTLGSFCQTFAAAAAVSAAAEGRRRPSPRDLRVLGIDAGVFDNIRRF
jgi:hypothetical protein